jgi:hypothetical protein
LKSTWNEALVLYLGFGPASDDLSDLLGER